MTNPMLDVVVVGAGLSGLVCARELARRGLVVREFSRERNGLRIEMRDVKAAARRFAAFPISGTLSGVTVRRLDIARTLLKSETVARRPFNSRGSALWRGNQGL